MYVGGNMDKVKNIIKIAIIIIVVVALVSTFSKALSITQPTDTSAIFMWMYFIVIILALVLKLMPDKEVKLNKIKDKVENNEFQGIYQQLLAEHKAELDKYRKQILVKRIIQILLGCVFAVTYLGIKFEWIVYLDKDFALLTPYIAVGAVVLLFVSFFVNTKAETTYRKIYKEKVIGVLIKALGKDLSYSADAARKTNVLNAYAKAGFDVTTYNRSNVDDYIFGSLEDELTISMADLQLKRETGSGKNRRVIKVFAGVFVDITATKNVDATIKILANTNKKHSKIDLIDNKLEKLEMDSQAFEKYFNVYTDNKIISMQLLTSEILEMLTELRNTFGVDMEIVIKENHVYLRFHTGAMFEAAVFGSSIKKNDLLTYYGVLKMVTVISKKVNEIIVNSDI